MSRALVRSTIIVLSGAAICAQESPRTLTLEEVVGASGVSHAVLSPDGRQVLFIQSIAGNADLFVVPTNGGFPLRLTHTPESESDASWSPDGRRISFLRSGDLWVMAGDGSAPRRLTTGHRAEGPVWSPNAKELAFVSNLEGNQDIAVVGVESGWPRRITTTALDESGPSWSPDGQRLAFVRRDRFWTAFELWMASAVSGDERKLFSTDTQTTSFAAQWSPKGEEIAVLHNGDGYDHVWLISTAGGTPRQLTTGQGEDSSIRWAPDGSRLAYSTNIGDPARRTLRVVSIKGGPPLTLSGTPGIDTSPSWSADGAAIAFLSSGYNRPPDVWVVPSAGGVPSQVTRSGLAGVRDSSLAEPQHVTYKSADGLDVPAILYRPKGEGRRFPALIYLIGGPGGQNTFSWDPFKQYLVQQGYVVLAPNYRGSGGYGKKYESLNDLDSSRGEVKDIAAGAEFLKRQAYVDGARLGVWGGSHGGTLTMQSITRYPELFRAAVEMYGVVNRETYVQRSDKLGRLYWLRFMGGPPPLSPELYEFSNTLKLVKDIRTPLLVLHGEEDPRVPPFESQQLVDELKKQGKVYDYHTYPGEPHGFRKPENQLDAYKRIVAWFARYLYPEYEPARKGTSPTRSEDNHLVATQARK